MSHFRSNAQKRHNHKRYHKRQSQLSIRMFYMFVSLFDLQMTIQQIFIVHLVNSYIQIIFIENAINGINH